MLYGQVHLTLPAWVHDAVDTARAYRDDADKVGLAIELSRRNIDARSGGPFGAAIFAADDRVIAIGVNRVLPQHCSLAHAETLACMLAQQRLQRARMNENEAGMHDGAITLATSSQPCCQCYGAVLWAGIDRLLIGARSQDVMALTQFDEGPLPADWIGELERRGIAVVRDLQRDAACEVLRDYGRLGGPAY
ncbi:MAG: nucleoside deaminase [Gammaproteobacteria bacterium]|nr:nucleoside deaminase [Gammaproteobacteria bacterium]